VTESKFPMEFKQCPICGCEETIARIGFKDEPTLKGTASLETKITPLFNPTAISILSIPCLIRRYDDCAKCGITYCTKVDKQAMPADVVFKLLGLQPITGQKPFIPPGGGRG